MPLAYFQFQELSSSDLEYGIAVLNLYRSKHVSDGLLPAWVEACESHCFLKTSKQNASFEVELQCQGKLMDMFQTPEKSTFKSEMLIQPCLK